MTTVCEALLVISFYESVSHIRVFNWSFLLFCDLYGRGRLLCALLAECDQFAADQTAECLPSFKQRSCYLALFSLFLLSDRFHHPSIHPLSLLEHDASKNAQYLCAYGF